ncbi:MAG: hypothetical protein AVDCRST_MAG17-629 [uncultured Solirubrobacterales bacterium]|uniref:Uncharacterized protein n=1 Tax=uncultured Solirubrobacterales bacterium TaxID=768556 RepID=A0A6J4S3S5_9ACTN|nr:MAG: hypothetical protein AVDCRST_MAG17-629 [uncultured Solirubrobacterales bacterium]
MKAASLNSGPGKAAAVAAVCGVIVLISMFLPWAKIVGERDVSDVGLSAWEALSILDVLIALLTLASVAVAALVVIRQARVPTLALSGVGLVTVVLILLAPLVEDPSAQQPVDFGGSWFLGLLAALGVMAAGLVAYGLLWYAASQAEDGDG